MPLEEALSHLGLANALSDNGARSRHREQGVSMLRELGARPWGYDSMAAAAVASEVKTSIVT